MRCFRSSKLTEESPVAIYYALCAAKAALQIWVMTEDDDVVFRQVDVRLEGVGTSLVNGGTEGAHSVFGVDGFVSAVGYRLGQFAFAEMASCCK